MRQTSVVKFLLVLCLVSITSAGRVKEQLKDTMDKYQKVQVTLPQTPSAKGLMQNIQNAIVNRQVSLRIPPIPFVSTIMRGRNGTRTNPTSSSDNKTAAPSTTASQNNGVNTSSTVPPIKAGGLHSDWCGGNILLDLNSRRELTYKSTQFPSGRSTPYACSWDVKVNKNCRRGRVTMRMDGRSRLAHEQRCTKGYYRVSPFMKEAKICGRIGAVPSYQWSVDDQNPEDVTIIMKNIGLNDGNSEGLSFTLSGECLTDSESAKSDSVIDNVDMNSRWMNRLLMDSLPGGRLSEVVLHTASMSFMPSSKLSAKASEKISQDLGQATTESASDSTTTTATSEKKPTKITFYSPLYLIFRKLNII